MVLKNQHRKVEHPWAVSPSLKRQQEGAPTINWYPNDGGCLEKTVRQGLWPPGGGIASLQQPRSEKLSSSHWSFSEQLPMATADCSQKTEETLVLREWKRFYSDRGDVQHVFLCSGMVFYKIG